MTAPQIICHPAPNHNVNFGARGRVLIYNERSALIWFPGAPYYASFMEGTKYGESSLQIVRNSNAMSDCYETLHRHGRLSKKLILSLAEKIDKEFGVGSHAKIDIKSTRSPGSAPWFKAVSQKQLDWDKEQREIRAASKKKIEARRKARLQLPRAMDFEESELRTICERFRMANDQQGREIAQKAWILLKHAEVDRLGKTP